MGNRQTDRQTDRQTGGRGGEGERPRLGERGERGQGEDNAGQVHRFNVNIFFQHIGHIGGAPKIRLSLS